MQRRFASITPHMTPAIRLALGVLFLLSSIPKTRHPYAYLESVYGYQLVSAKLGMLVAIVVPWAELIVALCLLAGVFVGGALLLTAFMGAVFTFANCWAVLHGLAVSCGCFGTDAGASPVGLKTVALSSAVMFAAGLGLAVHLRAKPQSSAIRTPSIPPSQPLVAVAQVAS